MKNKLIPHIYIALRIKFKVIISPNENSTILYKSVQEAGLKIKCNV